MWRFIIAISLVTAQAGFSQNSVSVLKRYTKDVQKIILIESGAFRGFNYEDKRETIKAKETLKLQMETDTSLLYTLYLDSDDSADLIYYLDKNGNAKSFAIVFVLADENEEKSLKTKLLNYYQERFGAYTVVNQEDELWDSRQGYFVEMRDTSDEAGMEIEILYYRN